MRKGQTAKALPPLKINEEEEWDYLEYGTLKESRTACVCITCQHFSYCCDKHCRTLLTCGLQQRLIPHGEHLSSRCAFWQRRSEKEIGWCPEWA
ncbi:galactose oxidase [Prochlorococcus sp. MIT 1300]|uniref:galactose oxidase n=1 Tax=Prochlorococcus sp. MIT 1300 TaxID=3096218 RepID=UPI002A764848|nr:galactose oxidase [Prochlorococcus sp. MIT 1300]